jgi:hypothetical protein
MSSETEKPYEVVATVAFKWPSQRGAFIRKWEFDRTMVRKRTRNLLRCSKSYATENDTIELANELKARNAYVVVYRNINEKWAEVLSTHYGTVEPFYGKA